MFCHQIFIWRCKYFDKISKVCGLCAIFFAFDRTEKTKVLFNCRFPLMKKSFFDWLISIMVTFTLTISSSAKINSYSSSICSCSWSYYIDIVLVSAVKVKVMNVSDEFFLISISTAKSFFRFFLFLQGNYYIFPIASTSTSASFHRFLLLH